jgi:hypothetical protein
MNRLLPPILVAAVILTAVGASFGARADACNPGPGPKPGPSVPLASIDLSTETITASSTNASISPIDFGSDISLTIPNRAAPRSYGLSIPLSSGESLAVLTTGGAAITQTYPIPPGDYPGSNPPTDYEDSLDQVHSDSQIEPTPDDGSGDIEDDQDPSWYPDGDAVDSGTRDGSDIASDAFDQAASQLPDGNWVMVSAFDPPLATDANGQSVRVSLAKSADSLTVSISPPSSAVFPIEVKLAYGYNPDSYKPPVSSSSGTGSRLHTRAAAARSAAANSLSAQDSTACSGDRPEVVVSDSSGWKFITDAFKRYPASCTDYYISVAPGKGTDMPRPRSAQNVKALNRKVTRSALKNYPRWNSSGARFTPLAEINYGLIPGSIQTTATNFATLMRQRGYRMWSIDEFSCDFVRESPNPAAWNDFSHLVDGLSQSGANGVAFNCVENQAASRDDVRALKAHSKALLSDTVNFDWNALSATKIWADEDYTLCSEVCVPGASLGEKATKTNAYMQKSARLAFAPDAPTTAPTTVAPIRTFLQTRFTPLVNGWGAVEGNTPGTNGYGTYDLKVGQIERLASLQVYAARAWIQPQNPYAGLRIGIRWVDRTDPGNGWRGPQRAALAQRIASAIAGAYSPSGRPLGACDPTGGNSTKLCQAAASGANFTSSWAAFRLWGSASCTRPSNDDFANATEISGFAGSIPGTTKCSTWESGEPHPNGDETGTVWYRWDIPSTDYPAPEWATAVDSTTGDYLETNIYTGDSLGKLTPFHTGCGATPSGTYWIQVVDRKDGGGDLAPGPFTLSWYPGQCYL